MSAKTEEQSIKRSREGGKTGDKTQESSSQSQRSQFDPDVITEDDIEKIWARMKKLSAKERKQRRKRELNLSSTDTTPTTDYSDMYFNIQPENLKEVLDLDKKKAKMEEVLRMKRSKPKTYLTQVILYDNVSHERILNKKIHQLQHRHKDVEKKIKRRKETFIHKLETKQNEWTRLDARTTQKFQPENMPDLSFKFGRLYHSANYPYQAAINTLRGIQPPRAEDHKKPRILPQITRRKVRKESVPSEADSGHTNIFITRMPKQKKEQKEFSRATGTSEDKATEKSEDRVRASWTNMNQATTEETTRPVAHKELPPVRGRHGQRLPRQKNWLEDSRYITLTSLLGPRFSPKKKFRGHDLPPENLAW